MRQSSFIRPFGSRRAIQTGRMLLWARCRISEGGTRVLIAAACALLLALLLLVLTGRTTGLPDYALAAVRGGAVAVPRHFAAELPEALQVATGAREPFLSTMLPIILRANEVILTARARLRALAAARDAGRPFSRRQRQWLSRLAARYRLAPEDIAGLMVRVDAIPPSLALAQAAVESSWGRSRFAREGNALFGLRSWAKRKGQALFGLGFWSGGEGLVPTERRQGARFTVKRYRAPLGSVHGYMHTLNTHPAYAELRRRRAAMRAGGQHLDGRLLAPALLAYSEKGGEYTDLIATVIRQNQLWQFDTVQLAPR